jgi:hypothetical protein
MILLDLPHYTSSIIEENDHDIHIQIALTNTTYLGDPKKQNKGTAPEGLIK